MAIWHKLLLEAIYIIHKGEKMINVNLHSYLKKVLEEYGSERNKSFGGNKFAKDIRENAEDVIPNNLFPRDEYMIVVKPDRRTFHG